MLSYIKFTFAISSPDEFLVKLWLIICQIFVSDRGRFTLRPSLRVIPRECRHEWYTTKN